MRQSSIEIVMELSIQFKFSFSWIKQHKKSPIHFLRQPSWFVTQWSISNSSCFTKISSQIGSPLLLLALSAIIWRLSRKDERQDTVEMIWLWRVLLFVTKVSNRGKLPCSEKMSRQINTELGAVKKTIREIIYVKDEPPSIKQQRCCKLFIWLESSGLIEQVSLGNFIPGRLFILPNFVCESFYSTSYLYRWWIETFYKRVGLISRSRTKMVENLTLMLNILRKV